VVAGRHGVSAFHRETAGGAASGVFFLYDVLVRAAVALLLVPWELARRMAKRTGPEALRQRLGEVLPDAGPGPRVLIHAVSVGEMAAAGSLVSALAHRIPDVSIQLATGNRDGLAAAEQLRARQAAIRSVSLIPWDRRHAMREWLRRSRPDFVAVVETEIWPNLFRACAELSIPIAIVNGRMPSREAGRYRLARPFFRKILNSAAWIEAQTEGDRRRFVAVGADADRVTLGGNLKFDASPGETAPKECDRDEMLVVGGSTHAPEERILLEVLRTLRAGNPSLRLALAPRRVSRARSVARRARAGGFRTARDPGEAAPWDVLVVDRIGGLAPLYARAGIAIVGGTIADRGGQSPLEAARSACAIVAGTSRENFSEVFAGLEAAGAVQSADAGRLAACIASLLSDRDRRRELGRRAREFSLAGGGAAARCANRIVSSMAGATPRRIPIP
jgi:3-deoxy-D-manno-octulosonic-acid transferase